MEKELKKIWSKLTAKTMPSIYMQEPCQAFTARIWLTGVGWSGRVAEEKEMEMR